MTQNVIHLTRPASPATPTTNTQNPNPYPVGIFFPITPVCAFTGDGLNPSFLRLQVAQTQLL
jgi:hypothetical protein